MSDCAADFPDGRNFGGCSEITEVIDNSPLDDRITSLPYQSEEISRPSSFIYEEPLSPRTYRNPPDETSDKKKLSNKQNWKKKIANRISKIVISGRRSSSAKHQKSSSFSEVNPEAGTSKMDELSTLFRKSEKDKTARPPSWRKVLMCSSMREPDEDKFTADQSLQSYIDSWN